MIALQVKQTASPEFSAMQLTVTTYTMGVKIKLSLMRLVAGTRKYQQQ